MRSLYLSRLSSDERAALEQDLLKIQNDKCFICEERLDLKLQEREIDHVEPINTGGKDNPDNFAITHSHCNESKQDANLRVARVLARFSKLRDKCASENRSPDLNDVLALYGGSQFEISFDYRLMENTIRFSLDHIRDASIIESRVYMDELSKFKYFFTKLPIEYLFHDDKMNPRSIGQNLAKLVKEFYQQRPQLHVSLGWIDLSEKRSVRVRLFDGQHKAAAQVLLGVKELPIRIFINPDQNTLLTTNTNAGTTLRQVAFDKSVQRHLGSQLYLDRIRLYQEAHGLAGDDFNFSEQDLVDHFKGESREMKRFILDATRDNITHHQDNKLKEFIDFGGRTKEKPISYSSIEKTFYSFFIFQNLLQTPLDFKFEEGNNPRQLEQKQILALMNIIAEEILIGRYQPEIGTHKIENRLQNDEDIPEPHLVAHRISREEIMYTWLRYIKQIVNTFFTMEGKPVDENQLLQYEFPPQLWARIRTFVRNLRDIPVWVNKELSKTVFGGKQNYDYWQSIFEKGATPDGVKVLLRPINLMEMIKDK